MKHAFLLIVETEEYDRESVKDVVEDILQEGLEPGGEITRMTVKPEPEEMKEAVEPVLRALKTGETL